MEPDKIAFRILASLYPDAKPSEIRKVIDEAMKKDVNDDDISLWKSFVSRSASEQKEEPKVIERHYYHDCWRPWYTTTNGYDDITINCGGSTAGTHSNRTTDGCTSSSTTYAAVNNC